MEVKECMHILWFTRRALITCFTEIAHSSYSCRNNGRKYDLIFALFVSKCVGNLNLILHYSVHACVTSTLKV